MVRSVKNKEKREHWLDHADDKYDRGLIEDIKALLRVLVLFIPLPVFWALFDQQVNKNNPTKYLFTLDFLVVDFVIHSLYFPV